MRKKHVKYTKIILCLMLAVLLSMTLVACNVGVFDTKNDGILNPSIISPKATSFVCMDINPSIEMVLDQNDMVLSVASANEDGLIMLWNEDGIVGANLQVAVKKITQLALDYGYLNENNAVINVSVSTIAQIVADEDEDDDKNDDAGEVANDTITEDITEELSPEQLAKDTIVENVKLAIDSTIKQAECGFDIVIDNGSDIVLSCELDELKNTYPYYMLLEDMDVETYRLIKRAMAYDNRLSLEKAIALDKDQLLSMVNDAQANSTNKLGKAFEKAQADAQFEYENEKQALMDELYILYFIKNLNSAQNFGEAFDLVAKIGYATQYSMLHSVQISLTRYATYLRDFISNPIYQEDDVQTIFDALSSRMANLDYNAFKEKVCDSDGCVTLENINAYLNGLYRKCSPTEREAFCDVYTEIKDILSDLVNIPESKVTEIRNSLQQVVDDSLSSLSIQLGDMLDTIRNCLPDIIYNNIESVDNAILAIEDSMNRAYANMRLTADDLDNIAKMQEEINASFDEIKKALNDRITDAKTTAIQILDEKKNRLKSAN